VTFLQHALISKDWKDILPATFSLEWTGAPVGRQITTVGQTARPTCLVCGATLPLRDKGQRTYLCFECKRLDSLKTDKVTGWLKGELQPPK
jgi:hypothetical protein